jgi:hypothetical protein
MLSDQQIKDAIPNRQSCWTDEYMCFWMGRFIEREVLKQVEQEIDKLKADNTLLAEKVKELEKGHEADARQINYLVQREVELINKIAEFVKGTKFGGEG